MESVYAQSPYMQYAPHHPLQPAYHGAQRSSRSRLSDNITSDGKGGFSNPDIRLIVSQEPKEALVLAPGKEKSRKPVDPPPVVELKVISDTEVAQHFLQSPYLFMVVELWKPDKDERCEDHGSNNLYGGLCSSLHRLKDTNNKDGGYFIFGDISVRATGKFRLNFNLYDLQKEPNAAVFLGNIVSKPFNVLPAKDFQGLDESTYMSRAFSDQGVRLRLRKEPRAFAGNKRHFYSPERDRQSASTPAQHNVPARTSGNYYTDDPPPQKRQRTETEDQKEVYVDHSGGSQSNYASSYAPTPQASYPASASAYPQLPQATYSSSYPSSAYPSLPHTGYASSSYGQPQQPNYGSQYVSSSPYPSIRSQTDLRMYNVSTYSTSSLGLENMPQSNLSQSHLTQPNLSQSNLTQPNLSQSHLTQPHPSQPTISPYPELPDPSAWPDLPPGWQQNTSGP